MIAHAEVPKGGFMNTLRMFFLLSLLFLVTGCTGMLMTTPQIRLESADRKMEVKSKVSLVSVLDYSPDGKILVSNGGGASLKLWDLQNAKAARQIPFSAE